MRVVIASGKGGTGKTTLTTALARVWDTPLILADFDIEEPNLHLFLEPNLTEQEIVYATVPVVDLGRCKGCGECAEFCQFKAISVLGGNIVVFPEMCHSCGGCLALCPKDALRPGKRELGVLSVGTVEESFFIMGTLRVGEAMSPPLLRSARKRLVKIIRETGRDALIDAPPGVSCPAVNAVMDNDMVVLVTEPTPFGLHDLRLAVAAFSPLKLPMGVVINRAGLGTDDVELYCLDANLPILGKIPWDRNIAVAYAQGKCIAEMSSELHELCCNIRDSIREVACEGVNARA